MAGGHDLAESESQSSAGFVPPSIGLVPFNAPTSSGVSSTTAYGSRVGFDSFGAPLVTPWQHSRFLAKAGRSSATPRPAGSSRVAENHSILGFEIARVRPTQGG